MPKKTFYNLSADKKEHIINALKKEFEVYPVFEASVASIIKRADISRGSFYQYFENLEDSFFTILELEIVEIHDLFIDLIKEEKGNLFSALNLYGDHIAAEIFKPEKYNIYKNRYLYWNRELDEKWKKFRRQRANSPFNGPMYLNSNDYAIDRDSINFLSAIIKDLIENLFIEEWDKETFLKKYEQYIYWTEYGLGAEKELYGDSE